MREDGRNASGREERGGRGRFNRRTLRMAAVRLRWASSREKASIEPREGSKQMAITTTKTFRITTCVRDSWHDTQSSK